MPCKRLKVKAAVLLQGRVLTESAKRFRLCFAPEVETRSSDHTPRAGYLNFKESYDGKGHDKDRVDSRDGRET